MTCKMCLKACSVRIGVSQHIFLYLGLTIDREGGGGVYIFGKVSSLGVQKFQKQSHMSYKRKAIVAEA